MLNLEGMAREVELMRGAEDGEKVVFWGKLKVVRGVKKGWVENGEKVVFCSVGYCKGIANFKNGGRVVF